MMVTSDTETSITLTTDQILDVEHFPPIDGDRTLNYRQSKIPDIDSSTIVYTYRLSRSRLKAVSHTSALLSGFAMVALVELNIGAPGSLPTPPPLLITFAVVTTVLIATHILALMLAICIQPHVEAATPTESPHRRLATYINAAWCMSTFAGLVLFLLEFAVILYIKFGKVRGDYTPAIICSVILVPILCIFILFAYKFYRDLSGHRIDRLSSKVSDIRKFVGSFDQKPTRQLPSIRYQSRLQNVNVEQI